MIARELFALLLLGSHEAAAPLPDVERWRQRVVPELRAVVQRSAHLEAERASIPVRATAPDYSAPGYRSGSAALPDTEKWVQVDLGKEMPVDDIVLMPAVLPTASGAPEVVGFPVRFSVEVSNDILFGQRVRVFDQTAADFPHPGPTPVMIRRVGKTARYVRVTAQRLAGEPDNYFFALGELVVCSGNRNVADGAGMQALDMLDSPRWKLHGVADGVSVAGRPAEERFTPTNGYHGRTVESNETQWVQVDLGSLLPINEVTLIPARPVGYPDTIGFGFPTRFRVEVSEAESFSRPVVIADYSSEAFPNPGDRRVSFFGGGVAGRFVRVTALELWRRGRPSGDHLFALAELEVRSGGLNVALAAKVEESSPLESPLPLWGPAYLVDGVAPPDGVGNYADWLAALARLQVIDGKLTGLRRQAGELRATADQRLASIAGGLVLAGGMVGGGGLMLGRRRQRQQAQKLRAGIARDLHDEIGSNLSSIGLLSELALDSAADPAAMQAELKEIRRVAMETADSMHDIVWLISPGRKTVGELSARLRETAELMLSGMQWTMDVEGLDAGTSLSLEAQRDVFLVFKEALHNIRRHAGATDVRIRLARRGRSLAVEVEDNGRGFDVGGTARGYGIANMRQRAAACRGEFRLRSGTGQGTAISLLVPCR
jgi:signal transduction histidine kinase